MIFTGRKHLTRCLGSLLAGLLLCLGSPIQGLELLPVKREQPTSDGDFTHVFLEFPDGDRVVQYYPPEDWTYRGSKSRISFVPPQKAQASVVIDVVQLKESLKFDEEGIEYLREQTLKGLPPESVDQEIVSDTPDFAARSTFYYEDHEVVAKFNLAGVPFKRSVLYLQLLNRPLLVRFTTTSQEEDFDKLRQTVGASTYTWQWSDPEE